MSLLIAWRRLLEFEDSTRPRWGSERLGDGVHPHHDPCHSTQDSGVASAIASQFNVQFAASSRHQPHHCLCQPSTIPNVSHAYGVRIDYHGSRKERSRVNRYLQVRISFEATSPRFHDPPFVRNSALFHWRLSAGSRKPAVCGISGVAYT